jgi:hypothetical protein
MQQISTSGGLDNDVVRRKAYELWVNGGRRGGVAEQNWLEAEQILSSTKSTVSIRSTSANPAPRAPDVVTAVQVPEKPIMKASVKPNGSAKRGRQ